MMMRMSQQELEKGEGAAIVGWVYGHPLVHVWVYGRVYVLVFVQIAREVEGLVKAGVLDLLEERGEWEEK